MDVRLRSMTQQDIEFVLAAERHPENAPFITQWTYEQHDAALQDGDSAHFIIETTADRRPVGFLLLAGFANPDHNIELRRIAINEKGKGYGRTGLRLAKQFVFDQKQAHRLWLDVKDHNLKAQHLYQSEGFVPEGRLRECIKMGDRYESLIIMSMLESEYRTTVA
ncbi:GNAT family N-acetyltransferase [Oculatella sp. LEGE 06141]|uniref:GNAT family N-acetyltransferase n=1 Tax=Oculatella sp. LEGE 06141 TaxID=1828648 RepID=UPI00187F11FF|nr:GNAT family protein [Oculatella sp. LEGE 06141]MBE9182237.1 GNAT family N-acetyltransferase [Oculatella sp. LEGE 06141]